MKSNGYKGWLFFQGASAKIQNLSDDKSINGNDDQSKHTVQALLDVGQEKLHIYDVASINCVGRS